MIWLYDRVFITGVVPEFVVKDVLRGGFTPLGFPTAAIVGEDGKPVKVYYDYAIMPEIKDEFGFIKSKEVIQDVRKPFYYPIARKFFDFKYEIRDGHFQAVGVGASWPEVYIRLEDMLILHRVFRRSLGKNMPRIQLPHTVREVPPLMEYGDVLYTFRAAITFVFALKIKGNKGKWFDFQYEKGGFYLYLGTYEDGEYYLDDRIKIISERRLLDSKDLYNQKGFTTHAPEVNIIFDHWRGKIYEIEFLEDRGDYYIARLNTIDEYDGVMKYAKDIVTLKK